MYDLYLAFLRKQLGASLAASGVDPEGHLGKLKGPAKSLTKHILQVERSSSPCIECMAVTCNRPELGTVDQASATTLTTMASLYHVSSCGTGESDASKLQLSDLSRTLAVIGRPELSCPDHARAAQVCQAAASAGRASEELLLEWPRFALRFGRVKAALAACEQATALVPASAELWRQRLVLETQHAVSKALLCHCCRRRNSV